MARVFVSYRREDASGHAGRVYDRLAMELGGEQIFMDVDAIRPGVDFVRELERAVGSCDVLLAVIGPGWATAAKGDVRRLDDPHDWVRVELAAGLKRADVTVVPVLVAGAEMPSPGELPRPLAKLARRQAHELDDKRFSRDATDLVAIVKDLLAAADRREEPQDSVSPAPAAPPPATPAPAAPPPDEPEDRERPSFRRLADMARGAAARVGESPSAAPDPAAASGPQASVDGRARVGATLRCRLEQWPEAGATRRQWLRCPPGGSQWSEIPEATAWMYTVAEADLGHHIAVRVSGQADGEQRTLTSSPVGPIGDALQATASRLLSAAGRRLSGPSHGGTSASAARPWVCDLCAASFATLEEGEGHAAEVHSDLPAQQSQGALRRVYIR